ncbi:MAG: DUF6090 family protein [Flavobacteriaceae bacterium]
MAKLFNNIRKKLVSEKPSANRTANYLKYAIGEIVLVVIGILIALSINNWNENRKQHLTDIEFLKSLKTEISIDTTSLVKRQSSYLKINNNLKKTLQLFNTNSKINHNEYEFISLAFNNLQVLTPLNKNTQRNDINIANGTLMRIDKVLNQDYLNYIETTKSNNDIISKLGESLQAISIQDVASKFDQTYTDTNSIVYDFDYNEIRNDRLIRNAIAKSLHWRSISYNWMKDQKEMATNILTRIDYYLRENK